MFDDLNFEFKSNAATLILIGHECNGHVLHIIRSIKIQIFDGIQQLNRWPAILQRAVRHKELPQLDPPGVKIFG